MLCTFDETAKLQGAEFYSRRNWVGLLKIQEALGAALSNKITSYVSQKKQTKIVNRFFLFPFLF